MKKHFVLCITVLTSLLSSSSVFAAGVKITNKTSHVVVITIEHFGLTFAADIPRIFFVSPGETISFDAGLGGIGAITASICDFVVKFDLTLAGTTGMRKCMLLQTQDGFILDVGQTGFLPPLGQFKGKRIKESKQKCSCLAPQQPSATKN
jgi:hypothetical protein